MHNFIGRVEELKRNLNELRMQSEGSVRFHLIDPVLRELGWTSPVHIRLEETQNDGKPDYTLYHNGEAVIIIEAKRMGQVSEKTVKQALNYCHEEGIPHFVVTDGDVWRIYDTYKKTPLADKIIVECSLSRDSSIDICRKLLSLWRYESKTAPQLQEAPLPLTERRPTAKGAAPGPGPSSTPDKSGLVGIKVRTATGRKPELIIFPDGTGKKVTSWTGLHSEVIRWLIERGSFDISDLPIIHNKKLLLNKKPYSLNGEEFRLPKNVKFAYYDGNRNAASHVREIILLLQHVNQDPEGFQVNTTKPQL